MPEFWGRWPSTEFGPLAKVETLPDLKAKNTKFGPRVDFEPLADLQNN